MKEIFFITKISMPGKRGVCFAIAQMCQAFAQNGHQVELILPNREIDQSLRNENFWDYFQIGKNVFGIKKLPVVTLPQLGSLEFIISHLRELVLGWSFSLMVFFYLWSARRSYVHLFTECKELLVLLRLLFWIYNPRVIYEVHILPQNFYERVLDWLGSPRADTVVATTRTIARHYRQAGRSVIVLPNGINLEDFDYLTPKIEIRQTLKVPLDRIIIGYGGRFVTDKMEKGIPELIKAFTVLKQKHKNILLLCVGGPLKYVDKYRILAQKSGLNSNEAIFLDHVPPKTLYQYMRIFDVCVMPFPDNSHFAHIMSPLKLFEYMASKNPIVATDLPSVREILTNGETAILAKPGDSNDLARIITLLINDEKLRERLAQKAFRLVSKSHTWRKRQAKITVLIAN